ncbi:ArnT family glycosyltransferase [Ahrensia kielensis]|uniref:ArnT family glycosyltransferase n=1 Tax=Ahrensia kielensis TaxID=76980 RepID=UPI00037EABB7|nr:glycosyltransferase family 39 protein [Ahrensia kielensis]
MNDTGIEQVDEMANAKLCHEKSWEDTVLPSRAVLVVLFAGFLFFKALYFFAMPLGADEAYYWLWGQTPALSYYDHPPLLAWVQTFSNAVFGWSIYSLRLVTLITSAAAAWIMWFWCKRLAPKRTLDAFLASIFFVMMTPLILRYQSIAIQDCLLIVFSMACAHFMALFVVSSKEQTFNWTYYWSACFFIGLAALSKYNGIFLALGFAAFVFVTPLGRGLLLRWQMWAGAALVLAMQAPVLIWNMQNDWPSFRYNLQDRIGQTNGGGTLDNFIFLALNSVVYLGPVFLIAAVRFVWPEKTGAAREFRSVARWVVIASTMTFIALSVTNTILPYWNMVAYAVLLPMLVFFVRSKLEFYIHVFFCLTIGAWLLVIYGIYPLYKYNGKSVRDIDISYGLSFIAQEIARAEAEVQPDFVMTTDYRTASMLAVTRGTDDVVKMGLRNDQFDFWFDPSVHKGQTALVLTDDFLPVNEMVDKVFEDVTFLRDITVRAYGYDIHTYHLYVAKNYMGEGPY